MSEVKNYYEILGLKKDASDSDIKKAYRKLAAKWHPDKFATASDKEKKEAEEKFKEINEANSVLSDPKKKSNYDQFGDPNCNPMGSGFEGFNDGFDPFEDFNPFGGGFGSHFGRKQRQPRVEKGEDVQINVDITIKEAYEGCKKQITYSKKVKCAQCNGTGFEDGKDHECQYCHGTGRMRTMQRQGNMTMINESFCPHCNGTGKDMNAKHCSKCGGSGYEFISVTETVDIPAGVDSGMYITLRELGSSPKNKGINGDLIIVFRVVDNEDFERDGNNLYKKLELNLNEAWCGTEKKIECIDGTTINVKIPELSEDGKTLRVRGKGMKGLRGDIGDMYLVVKYIVPKKLTNKQKDLLKEFYK